MILNKHLPETNDLADRMRKLNSIKRIVPNRKLLMSARLYELGG